MVVLLPLLRCRLQSWGKILLPLRPAHCTAEKVGKQNRARRAALSGRWAVSAAAPLHNSPPPGWCVPVALVGFPRRRGTGRARRLLSGLTVLLFPLLQPLLIVGRQFFQRNPCNCAVSSLKHDVAVDYADDPRLKLGCTVAVAPRVPPCFLGVRFSLFLCLSRFSYLFFCLGFFLFFLLKVFFVRFSVRFSFPCVGNEYRPCRSIRALESVCSCDRVLSNLLGFWSTGVAIKWRRRVLGQL